MKSTSVFFGVCLLFAAQAANAANYTVIVEPNYPPAQAREVYEPLMAYLGKATGHKFFLKTTPNYHVYWRDMRANSPVDFAFEEAHFTDYRINRQKFTPLVRVADPTKFTLLVNDAMAEGGAQGLVGHRIVSMSAPSLGYLLLGDIYKNPISQPEIQSVAANWKDGVDMLFAGETDAAMVPNYIAREYPNLTAVNESREFTGRAFSAAPTVPAGVRTAVANAMLQLHKDPNQNSILNEIGATQFVPATRADYVGAEVLLRDVFGYQPLRTRPAPAANPAPAPAQVEATR
jgi:ABC-type phosphate/phosphonate transport system substrate-binding protein